MKLINNSVPNPENPINTNSIFNIDHEINVKYYTTKYVKPFNNLTETLVEKPVSFISYFSTIKYKLIKDPMKPIVLIIEFSTIDDLKGNILIITSNCQKAKDFLNFIGTPIGKKGKDFLFYYTLELIQEKYKAYIHNRYEQKSCFLKEI